MTFLRDLKLPIGILKSYTKHYFAIGKLPVSNSAKIVSSHMYKKYNFYRICRKYFNIFNIAFGKLFLLWDL